MVSVHHLIAISSLMACSAPDISPVVGAVSEGPARAGIEVAPIASAAASAPVTAAASTSVSPPTVPAGAPSNALAITEGPCSLPAKRPSSFGVKMLQRVVPRGRDAQWFGSELAIATNVCPRAPDAQVTASCFIVTEAAMDTVYKSLVTGRFCSLRHQSPSPKASPHYGSRSIAVYVGQHWFEVGDTSDHLLDESSHRPFYEMADVITTAGSSGTGVVSPSP